MFGCKFWFSFGFDDIIISLISLSLSPLITPAYIIKTKLNSKPNKAKVTFCLQTQMRKNKMIMTFSFKEISL